MTIPNYQTTVAALAQQYPAEFSAAHRGGTQTEAFIKRLAWVLHQQDPLVGLNGKRGVPSDLSDDALCYRGRHDSAPSGDTDPTNGNMPVTVIDVIAGAPSGPTGPNGTPAWIHPLTPAAAAWVQPQPVEGTVEPPKPVKPPYAGDGPWVQMSTLLEADYKAAKRLVMAYVVELERDAEVINGLDHMCGVWFGRVCYTHYIDGLSISAAIAKHRAEWRVALGLPPV